LTLEMPSNDQLFAGAIRDREHAHWRGNDSSSPHIGRYAVKFRVRLTH
jgi:hypothetical protein